MKVKNFTKDDCKVIIKDAITLIMLDSLLSGDKVEDVKQKAYTVVADVIKELDDNITSADDLSIEAIMSAGMKKQIWKKIKGDKDEMEL